MLIQHRPNTAHFTLIAWLLLLFNFSNISAATTAAKVGAEKKVLLNDASFVLDSTEDSFLFQKNAQLWHYRVSTQNQNKISDNPFSSIKPKLHPLGSWTAFVEKQEATATQTLVVFDSDQKKQLFKSTPFSLFSFLEWVDLCHVLVGTSEEKPAKLYLFKVQASCADAQLSGVHTIFSLHDFGNYLIKDQLKLEKISLSGNAYEVQASSPDVIVGSLSQGGLFAFERKTGKLTTSPKGYRPSINPSGSAVIYQTPQDDIYIWDLKKNTHKKISKGETPRFLTDASYAVKTTKGVEVEQIKAGKK